MLEFKQKLIYSGYGAVGSALVWGARGREFKSRYSDQQKMIAFWVIIFCLLQLVDWLDEFEFTYEQREYYGAIA